MGTWGWGYGPEKGWLFGDDDTTGIIPTLVGIPKDITDITAAGFGGVGEFLLDIGQGTSDLIIRESQTVWENPIEDITKAWPMWGALAVVGYALFKR